MLKDDKPKSAKRREFLKLVGAAGAAGAAAVGCATGTAEAASQPQKGTTYRETAHVKKYYELAKF